MFLEFYRLGDQPFGVTPDPKYLFWSRSHREALASLYYGINSGCGFLALIAPPGMGKTTLLFHLLEHLRDSSRTAYLFHTQCSSREFLRFMMIDLGWNPGEQDPVALYERLYEILIAEARADRRFVLVIDEAQNLDDSVLETVRLLSNFETPTRKLMQVVLAGQPQLAAKLGRHELWQLRQRISIMSRLEPLDFSEVTEYVEHRCKVAGYEGASISTEEARKDDWSYFSRERAPLFTTEALALVAAASKGIPREINNLCFNALSLGYADQRRTIDAAIVRQVISDLELEKFTTPEVLSSAQQTVSVPELEGATGPEAPPRADVEVQDLSDTGACPPGPVLAAKVSSDASPQEEKPGLAFSIHPAMGWIARNRGIGRHIRPLMKRFATRRLIGVAASVAFLIFAGYLSISMLDRRAEVEPENTVHAASPPLTGRVTGARTAGGNRADQNVEPDGSGPGTSMTVITVTVGPDANLDYLSRKYLGRRLVPQILNEILLLNPQLVDPNKIESGARIRLPFGGSWTSASPAPVKTIKRDDQSQSNPAPSN